MAFEFERTHTFHGLPLDTATQRLLEFFLTEGYTLVDERDGWHWKRGKSGWIKREIERNETHVYVHLHPRQDGTRLHLRCTVRGIQVLVTHIDRMYWQLEWRALRAALSGETLPDWKEAYLACRNNYKRKVDPLLILVQVFLMLSLWYVGMAFLVRLLSPWSNFWACGVCCLFLPSSGLIGYFLIALFIANLIRPSGDAEQLWEQALQAYKSLT